MSEVSLDYTREDHEKALEDFDRRHLPFCFVCEQRCVEFHPSAPPPAKQRAEDWPWYIDGNPCHEECGLLFSWRVVSSR
jgi:hypothetical protein